MGFRIELGEIESTLNSFDYVASSAAIGIEHQGPGGTMIVAYIVPKKRVDDVTIRHDLGKKLPRYMVPRDIVYISQLPLNNSGKVDRIALKDMYLGRPSQK